MNFAGSRYKVKLVFWLKAGVELSLFLVIYHQHNWGKRWYFCLVYINLLPLHCLYKTYMLASQIVSPKHMLVLAQCRVLSSISSYSHASFVFNSLVCVFKPHMISCVFMAFIPFKAGTRFVNLTCSDLDSVPVYPITD